MWSIERCHERKDSYRHWRDGSGGRPACNAGGCRERIGEEWGTEGTSGEKGEFWMCQNRRPDSRTAKSCSSVVRVTAVCSSASCGDESDEGAAVGSGVGAPLGSAVGVGDGSGVGSARRQRALGSALGSAGHRCTHLLRPRLRPELDLAVEWWSADGHHVPRLVDGHRNPRPQPLRSPLRLSPLHSRKAECRSGCCEFGCEFECGGPPFPRLILVAGGDGADACKCE